jgi:hypothetical protein
MDETALLSGSGSRVKEHRDFTLGIGHFHKEVI